MKIKRNKFNEIIVQNVMDGVYPAYHNSKNGRECFSVYQGHKTYFKQDTDAPGVTIELKRPFQNTRVYLTCSVEEIAEYIANHEMNFEKYCDLDERIGEYCSENEWTYSGT